MGGLRRFRDLFAAVVSCALALAGLRALTPYPDDYGLGAKLEHFAEHRDEFDLVYLGSSRVYRSFVPELVDAELAARGHALRSFNLGVAGMGDFEADWLLREVLAMEPERLRRVVLEVPLYSPELFEANAHSARVIAWHDFEGTLGALEATELLAGASRHELLRLHLELWARRALHLGQGRRLIARALGDDRERARHGLSREMLGAARGYLALEDTPGEEYARRRGEFLAQPQEHARRVERIPVDRRLRPGLGSYPLGLLAERVASLRAAGIEPIFVAVPGARARATVYSLVDEGRVEGLLDFNDPARYPELFTPESRFDRNHLTRESAARFSRTFAAALARRLDAAAAEDER